MNKIIVMFIGLCAMSAFASSTNTNTVVRIGYLAAEVMQHPEDPGAIDGGWAQGYLDVVEKGARVRQIVVLYRKGASRPVEADRLIEITGTSEGVDLGGAPGTKNSYANELIRVQSWKYMGTTNTPNQASQTIGAEAVETTDLVWGTSTNGLSLAITQTPDGKDLSVNFRNDTSNALCIVTDSLWWHCDLFADGKRVPRGDDSYDIMLHTLATDSFARVESGKVLKCSVPLSLWEAVRSGEIRLRYMNTENMRQKNDGKEFGLRVWMGTIMSNGLRLKAGSNVPADVDRKLAAPQP